MLDSRDTVLDVGCGSGAAALALAGRVHQINGIDISSKMIELAKGKAAEQNVRNFEFVHATLFDEKLKT